MFSLIYIYTFQAICENVDEGKIEIFCKFINSIYECSSEDKQKNGMGGESTNAVTENKQNKRMEGEGSDATTVVIDLESDNDDKRNDLVSTPTAITPETDTTPPVITRCATPMPDVAVGERGFPRFYDPVSTSVDIGTVTGNSNHEISQV